MSQQFASRREILQNWNPEDKGFWNPMARLSPKKISSSPQRLLPWPSAYGISGPQ